MGNETWTWIRNFSTGRADSFQWVLGSLVGPLDSVPN